MHLPIVLDEGCGVQHQNSLVQVRGYGSGRWADRRTTLEERPICSEIQQVDEVKVRTNETVGEIVQVLLAINVHTHANTVCAPIIGKHVMCIPVVVHPA